MVEIDDMWISANARFARTQEEMDAFKKNFDVAKGSRLIAIQTWAADFVSKLSSITLLIGDFQRSLWARVAAPDAILTYRFFTSSVIPSISPEAQEAALLKLQTLVMTADAETTEEGSQIITLLKTVIDLNRQVSECEGRMKQFIQG